LLSIRTIEYKGEQCCGGEEVSQLPLKNKAFSIFLQQNPPFELRPEMAFSPERTCQRCDGKGYDDLQIRIVLAVIDGELAPLDRAFSLHRLFFRISGSSASGLGNRRARGNGLRASLGAA
jgi:hypothetical protein